jgi:hypothetical protein
MLNWKRTLNRSVHKTSCQGQYKTHEKEAYCASAGEKCEAILSTRLCGKEGLGERSARFRATEQPSIVNLTFSPLKAAVGGLKENGGVRALRIVRCLNLNHWLKRITYLFAVLILPCAVLAGTEYGRPDADGQVWGWDDPAGNNNNAMYDDVDESSASNADFITSAKATDTLKLGLSNFTTAASTWTATKVKVRARHQVYSGDGADGALTVSGANTVVNTYTYLTASPSGGATSITLNSATGFSAGDEIMIFQSQNGSTAGKYEFARIVSKATNTLTLLTGLQNAYTQGTYNTSGSNNT